MEADHLMSCFVPGRKKKSYVSKANKFVAKLECWVSALERAKLLKLFLGLLLACVVLLCDECLF